MVDMGLFEVCLSVIVVESNELQIYSQIKFMIVKKKILEFAQKLTKKIIMGRNLI
jgi:hypothetical protein